MSLLTVQNVADHSAPDTRILDSTSHIAFFVKWVDRVHKDVVYNTHYRHLAQAKTAITSVAGTTTYTLSATDVRRVYHVYDEANDRVLMPDEAAEAPLTLTDRNAVRGVNPPKAVVGGLGDTPFPVYYRLQTVTSGSYTHSLVLLPAPADANYTGTITVYYDTILATKTAGADTLLLSTDALPVMVAGVNALAHAYLKRPADAAYWQSVYDAMKGRI